MHDMIHSYVWHDPCVCVTRLVHICGITHNVCLPELIHTCDMTHGPMSRWDLQKARAGQKCVCVCVYIYIYTYQCMSGLTHKLPDSFICVTCHTYEWISCRYIQQARAEQKCVCARIFKCTYIHINICKDWRTSRWDFQKARAEQKCVCVYIYMYIYMYQYI